MRVGLRDGADFRFITNIMSQHCVVDPKVGCRAIRKMANHKSIRFTSMLMHNYKICKVMVAA